MVATAIIAFLAGTVILYAAVRMIKSREFIVSVSTLIGIRKAGCTSSYLGSIAG